MLTNYRFSIAISFAGDNKRDKVREIAEHLRGHLGNDKVFFDEFFKTELAGDRADLYLQDIYRNQTQLVVTCVCKRYNEKKWTLDEWEAIREFRRTLRDDGSGKTERMRFLPLRFGDGDVEGIFDTAIVPDVREDSTEKIARLILDRLELSEKESGIQSAEDSARQADVIEWPELPIQMNWPLADHGEVRDAFSRLLTGSAPWRLLTVHGSSELGKSFIARQMLVNALQIPNLSCGLFNFKGTTDMGTELRAFVQHLNIPFPSTGDGLNEHLSYILEALKKQSKPTLLIFDTYEVAGEAQDWVEMQLLLSLIRATWLRVVITGQRVPKHNGTTWQPIASPPVALQHPPPKDWFDYGKRYRPDLTLVDVETACGLTNKGALLGQLLGPET